MWVGAGWVGPGYEHYGWSFTYDPSAPDTVIGGVAYMNWNGMPVRESGTGQVYYRRPWMEEDLLWYDYDVAVGDTVRSGEVMGFPSVDAVRVVSVDTVFLVGTPRKRIGVASLIDPGDWPCAHWIQGVGSTLGPFNMCAGPSVSGSQWLVCMSVDGIVHYGLWEGEPNDCMVHLGVPARNGLQPALRLRPNPGSGELSIGLGNAVGLVSIRVFNMSGQMVHSSSGWAGSALDTTGWPAGIYLVEARDDGGTVRQGRWVKLAD